MADQKIIQKTNEFGETYFYTKHKSGLDIYVIPKDFATNYAVFATKYGAIDNCFKLEGEERFHEVPDGIAHYLEHKMFENEDGIDTFSRFAKYGASATFDAMVFASLLNSFDTFDNGFTITFKPLNVQGRNRKQILRHHIDDLIEKFYRRSKFPRNMVAIHRCEDLDFFGSFDLEFCTVKPIFDVCLIACDIFGDEIDGIKFKGGPTFELTRSPNIDLDDYVTRPFDKITSNFVYRQFRGFGQYSDNREILKLLKPNL